MMTRLQEQLEELEVLECMFSAPGEFKIVDESSREQAEAYLKQLTPDPPDCLSCQFCIPISAHQEGSDEEASEEESCACGEDIATQQPLASHSINFSVRLPTRLV